MALKLHGFAVSNYYNMVRLALELKGIDYETVQRFPSQDEDWLALSPLGKVPCLETPEGTLAETIVILEYLEECYPATPLIGGSAFERAQVRQLMQIIKLYIELPARRLYSGVFFGGQNPEWVVDDVKPVLAKGVRALNTLGQFGPFLTGPAVSAADIMLLYTLDLAAVVARKTYDWDLMAAIDGSSALVATLNENPIVQRIADEKQAEMAAFMAMRAAK